MRTRAVALAATVSLGVLAGACTAAEPAAPAPPVPATPPGAATTRYHEYAVTEVAALQTTTRTFTDAVRAGDIAAAKTAYAPARVHYEAIAWVTESFEDVGVAIDGQAADAPGPAPWTGFHRVEKALWADGSLVGMTPFANALDLDVMVLKARVARQTFRPDELATGAGDLLTAISTTTVTGREDPYAHTDLWDLAAGIAGARVVFELLQPEIAAEDPALARLIEARFAAVAAALDPHRQGTGYVDYATVPAPARRVLSEAVDALAEPLSQVAAKVGGQAVG